MRLTLAVYATTTERGGGEGKIKRVPAQYSSLMKSGMERRRVFLDADDISLSQGLSSPV